MANYKPELHNADDIINYYDQYDEPGYSVYAGHKPDQAYCRFTYTGDDKTLGRQKLMEALQSVLSNPDNTNTYLLQILSPKGKKTEVLNSITFQLNKSSMLMPYQGVGNYNPGISNEIALLRADIAALKMQQDIDDDFEDEPEEENFIAGLMKKPEVQQLILQQLGNLFMPQQKVTHVSGINEQTQTEVEHEEQIYDAVEQLKKYDNRLGEDLELLVKMAENDKRQFDFLLKMLRSA